MLRSQEFLDAEAYLRQQEQAFRLALEEERSALVIPAIYTFAIEHFEPIVHEVSKAVPTAPEISQLSLELANGGEEPLVNPQLQDALPMRDSEEKESIRRDSLYLPIDGGFLKIATRAGTAVASGRVFMKVANYGYANREESRSIIEKRARFGDEIEPDATIFIPRRAVQYDQGAPPDSSFMCSYEEWGNPVRRVAIYSGRDTPPPEELSLLHTAFMRETRVALTGLLSVLIR